MIFVAKNVFMLFALIFVGYYVGVRKIISENGSQDLSNLLVRITMPLTILYSLIRPYDPQLMRTAMLCALGAAILLPTMAGLSYLLIKIFRIPMEKQGVWMFALTFSNNGFLGLPLMFALFGKDGLFFMTMANVVQNILIFTLGIKMINHGYRKAEVNGLKDILLNNVNIAIVIGLILFFTQLPVPESLTKILGYMAGMNTPLSMMVVGLSLAKFPLQEMFTDRDSYRLAVIRLAIFPVLFWGIMKLFNIGGASMLPTIMIYIAALPAPALASILAVRYDTNPKFAAQCIFISTLVSMITVPLIGGHLV